MSESLTLELAKYHDGTIQLIFWNWLDGKDAIYLLNEDGTAQRVIDGDEEVQEEVVPIENLVTELRNLHTWFNKQLEEQG